jgi:glutaredoxin
MSIVLYSRRGCHLCREAADLLEALAVPFTTVDIDGHGDLVAAFGTRVPVIEVDGRVVAEGRIDPGLVARSLAPSSR